MGFTDSFARGYEIGDAAKKRRATSKYFERFKELTRDSDAEVVTEIGGLDVPESALPVEGTAPTPVPAPEAISAGPTEGAPALEPDSALPLDMGDAESPVRVTAPKKIPLPQAEEARKSLTQANIKELDRLAMEAARASGDIEVYTALQKSTDSFLQSKVMRNIGLAQSAALNGKTDEVEKYLTKAYRFVPDGQEIKFKKDKDGQLTIKDPWGDKDIPLTSEMIGNIGIMLSNPEKWADIVRAERKDRGTQAVNEREVTVKEGGLKVDQDRLLQFGRQLGIQEKDLALKERQVRLEELMGPMDRMAKYQQGLYYGALKEQAQAAKANGKGDEFLDESIAMSKAIDSSMAAYTTPPNNPIDGKPDPNWKPPRDVMVTGPSGQRAMAPDELRQATGLAQMIGMTNKGAIGTDVATAAGLQLIKAQIDPDNFNAQIDAATGVMFVPFRGMNVPVKLPPALVQELMSQQESAAATSSAPTGNPFPEPGQFMPPGG